MNVLIACEYSGIVRDAFIRAGHNAWSCDLLPTEGYYQHRHLQTDVRNLIDDSLGRGGYEIRPGHFIWPNYWDLLIAHPPCTYLCNSGVRWLYEKPGRWDLMREGAKFFRMLLDAPIYRIAVENPIMHRHARAIVGRGHDQLIQPWWFGHGETKAICLWLKNLPRLHPTHEVKERAARIHRMAPGPDRGKERSRFYEGIAEAFAHQWGGTVLFSQRQRG